MTVAAIHGFLLAVRDDSACLVSDQALLDLLNIVGSRVGTPSESSVDAVDLVAFGKPIRNDLTAGFDGIDGLRRDLYWRWTSRDCHDIGDGQISSVYGQCRVGGQGGITGLSED